MSPRPRLPSAGLRLRVALAAAVATVVAVLAGGAVLVLVVIGDGHRALDDLLVHRARAVAVPATAAAALWEPGRVRTDGHLGAAGVVTRVLQDGRVLLEVGPLPLEPLPTSTRPGHATVRVSDEPWRVYTEQLPPGDSSPPDRRASGPLTLQLAAPLRSAQPSVDGLARQVRRIGGLVVVGAGVLGFATAGVALRPLRRLRAAAEQVAAEHDLSLRVPAGRGPAEVDAVAQSMNAMLAALESSAATTAAALGASRAFAADAGHELRTPLAVIRTDLEVLARNPGLPAADRDALLAEVEQEQARLLRTLDGLQLLARGDLGVAQLPSNPVDLADLVGLAVHDAARRWPTAELTVIDDSADVTVQGWAEGLRVLVDNLLRNAAVHAADADGRVRVEVTVRQAPDQVLLVVDDDGPGIPVAEREHVLDRFVRGTGATTLGSGLGLALAAQQAHLHNGRLELHDSPLGGIRALVLLGVPI